MFKFIIITRAKLRLNVLEQEIVQSEMGYGHSKNKYGDTVLRIWSQEIVLGHPVLGEGMLSSALKFRAEWVHSSARTFTPLADTWNVDGVKR